MFARVTGGALWGLEGIPVSVEADAGDGLPVFDMVGYLGSEVKEASTRVRTALINSGFRLPPKRITVSLSPADLRKQGNCFDLPIAIAILCACGYLTQEEISGWLFIGELALDGGLRRVDGALALAGCAVRKGVNRIFVPAENAEEAAGDPRVRAAGAGDLREVVYMLRKPEEIIYTEPCGNAEPEQYENDFSEVNGQKAVRRATEVAAAGMHNILYIGPPGAGKSMIAKRIPSILPDMTMEEKLEVSKIYSISGLYPENGGLISRRPFRSPHHTISQQALAGGGLHPKPGEVSLANRGVLFLDEFAEFKKNVLEVLRQPLEDGFVTISRVHGVCRYPTHIMLAAAMNPCPCGYYPDRSKCRCSRGEVERYLARISQPLLDRIDLCAEAAPVGYREMTMRSENESSERIRERVTAAVRIQQARYEGSGIVFNAQLKGELMEKYCALGSSESSLMEQVFDSLGLSARAYDRVLKVARTIADLEGVENIREEHLAEAVSYRMLDKKYWGG